MFTDEEIKKRIVDQLFWDSRVDASDIHIEINNSHVTLHGTVPTSFARKSAESDAWAVPGVETVENRITVQLDSPVPSSARELKDNIRNAFNWDPALAGEDLIISLEEGVVVLEGAVGHYWQKQKAQEKAKNIAGVIVVDNRIAVTPTHDIMDEIIAQDIINALERNIDIDIDLIDVKVEKGKVTLSGKVPDFHAYKTAENVVHFTTGVIDLQNDLSIFPLAM
ncbi:Osmotically inducible protein Y precursor [Chitinispirillum alkaliphilum]|nr:Osmotically inducible protein Y precursor [Chitinispirillum alkaliphilum]